MSKLKINTFIQRPVEIHEPDGTIHSTTDMLEFLDLRVQIRQLGLEGCFIVFDGFQIPITPKGKVDGRHPDGMFNQIDILLKEVLGF